MTHRRGASASDWPEAFHLAGAVLYMISMSSHVDAPRLTPLLRPYGSGTTGLVDVDGRRLGVARRVPPEDAAEMETANAAWGEHKARLLGWLRNDRLPSYAPHRAEPLKGSFYDHPNAFHGRWDWWKANAPKVCRADIDALLSGVESVAAVRSSHAAAAAAAPRVPSSKPESDAQLIARAYVALKSEGRNWSNNKSRNKDISTWIIENTGRSTFFASDRTFIRGVKLAKNQ